MTRATSLVGLLTACFASACIGSIGDRDGGAGAGDTENTGEAKGAQCTAIDPGSSPIRRLTRFEYDQTIRDLLKDESDLAQAGFVAEEESLGFNNQAAVLNVTQLLAEQYLEAAETLATSAIAKLDQIAPACDVATDGAEACGDAFIRAFGKKAFRRPLADDEVARFAALFTTWYGKVDYETGIRMVVTAMLQSSHFLYRVEFGMPDPIEHDGSEEVVGLGSWEMASRLSYLLWGSMPDDELLTAAEEDRLGTPEELETQARRMLDDPRARTMMRSFSAQWLGMSRLEEVVKDGATFPLYDDALLPLWEEETQMLIEHVVFDGEGDFGTLFTAPYSFQNAELAAFYDEGATPGAEFEKVDLDPAKRSGFLTNASLMGAYAKSDQTSPVHRGQFVRERLLCQVLPPPPDDVDINPPAIDPNATTRERFAQHSKDPACSGCHSLMDPIGFGFENYDGIGIFRTKEGNLPVDATGEINQAGDAEGTFDGAVELAQKLAGSEEVRSCFVTQWFRFAQGRTEEEADDCAREHLGEAFSASGQDIKGLLVALTQTDAFRFRRASEGGSP